MLYPQKTSKILDFRSKSTSRDNRWRVAFCGPQSPSSGLFSVLAYPMIFAREARRRAINNQIALFCVGFGSSRTIGEVRSRIGSVYSCGRRGFSVCVATAAVTALRLAVVVRWPESRRPGSTSVQQRPSISASRVTCVPTSSGAPGFPGRRPKRDCLYLV